MWQIVINGPGYFDTAYDLPDGITSLGRADENDIVLSGDLVSRHHARFQAEGDALAVEDLGSRNGTKLNGQPLHGSAVVKVGDVVSVGENALAVRQPSTVENAATEMVAAAGGVRRFGEEIDLGNAMVIAKHVKDSVVMRALDNVLPFSNPFGDNSPAPHPEQAANPALDGGLLLLLFRATAALSRAPSLQAFLDQTVDHLLEVVKATTAVVLLRAPGGTAMVPAAVRHRGALSQGEVPVSDAIISAALSKGEALAVADVRDDSRFAQRESVMIYGVDQVLCVPVGDKEPYAGVLYVNKSGGNQAELEQLLDVCTAVSHLITTGVAKFRADDRERKEDRLRRALERFHPPDVVERRVAELAKSGGGAIERLEQKHVSVVLADIAGFTSLVQKGDPDSVLEILNEFYQRMTGLVFSFDGTVDKFMGDAVLALFGAPYARGDDALRAVRAALVMRQDWNRAMRLRPPAQRLELRLAISTGPVLAGLVGPESRLDYTALGDTVNLAFALGASAQPGQILITSKTLAAIGARFDVTPLGDRPVRGKEKVAVFEVLEEDVPVHTNPGLAD